MLEKIFIFFVTIYQKYYPKKWKRVCHFYPSCSEYTKLAIKKYGFFSGLRMGLDRIKRCKPPVLDWKDFP